MENKDERGLPSSTTFSSDETSRSSFESISPDRQNKKESTAARKQMTLPSLTQVKMTANRPGLNCLLIIATGAL